MGASPDLAGLTEDSKQNIQQLQGLISRQPIGRKRGPIGGKISKLLVCGDQQMPETQMGIEEIRKALSELPHRQKEGCEFAQKNYLRKREGGGRVAHDLRFRSVYDFPLGATDDFDDSDYFGFCIDFANKAIQRQLEHAKELKFKVRDLETYGVETQEWR